MNGPMSFGPSDRDLGLTDEEAPTSKTVDLLDQARTALLHGTPEQRSNMCSFITDHLFELRNAPPVETGCEFALRGLYWDQVDYLTLNKLGGMNNHWMRAAREALGMDPNDTRPAPDRPELRSDSPEIQFADVFAELDKGYPVNTRDAMNSLWWKVRNQRREIARLHEKRGAHETSGWQPIETAPKDGRTLLLGHFNSAGKWRTLRGQWYSWDLINEEWEEPENGHEGWYETSVENDTPPNCWSTEPTHWMPTPSPPVKSTVPISASTGGTASPSRAPAPPVECPNCRTQFAFEGDECGLCKEEAP